MARRTQETAAIVPEVAQPFPPGELLIPKALNINF